MAYDNGDRCNIGSDHNDSRYGTNGESGSGNYSNGHHEHHGGNDAGWLSEFIGEIKRNDLGLPIPSDHPASMPAISHAAAPSGRSRHISRLTLCSIVCPSWARHPCISFYSEIAHTMLVRAAQLWDPELKKAFKKLGV